MKKPDGILRLKYRLYLDEYGFIIFEIIHQDKKITAKNKGINLGSFNGWKVRSWDCSEIRVVEREIYLKGLRNYMQWGVCVVKGDKETLNSIHKALELFIKSKFGNCKVIKG
jgi:hypothetical protein